ncbi:MAG: AsmA family protein, partial [Gammaproteobacteria bacterium]
MREGMTDEFTAKPRRPVALRVLMWVGIAIGIIIILIILAIVIIPHFANTAAIKGEIEKVASDRTGRNVTIAGPVSLSLFPWIGFDAHKVTMANAKGFGTGPFLRTKEVEIHAKLIPLIFGTVEVSGITLDTPTLALLRDKNGHSNWADLTGGGKSPSKSKNGKSKAPLARLSIGKIAINDGTLDYTDAESGKHYTIQQFGLKASSLKPGKPFPLSFRTQLSSDHPHFKADIQFNTTAEFDKTASQLTLTGGKLTTTVTSFGGNQPLNIDAQWKRIALNKNAGTATLAGLIVAFSDVRAQLDAKAKNLDSKPEVSGHLNIAPFSPRKLLATIGDPVPRSIKGFNHASLSSDLKASPNAVALSNLVLKLDGSTLTGSAGVPDLKTHALHFDLALDKLDLADYIVAGGGSKARIGTPHGKTFMETRLPGRLLKNLNLAGSLAIAKLSGFGLAASDLALKLNAANGSLHIAPIQAKLYSGNYTGDITLAAAGQGVRLNTTESLKSIDLGQLIGTLTNQKRLSGTSDLSFTLAGEGNTVGELMSTLKGSSDFSIKNGALEGINLWDALRRAYLLVKKGKRVPAKGPKRTEITNLKAHIVIDKGKLTNDTLVARLPFLAVTGHGTIDLVQHNAVDYRLLATVVKTPKISGEDLSALKSAEVPIRISGNLSDLSAYPDVETALKARVESAVKKKLDKKKKDLKKKLLQELLGNGDKDKGNGG